MSRLLINVSDIWIIFRTMSEGQHQTESLACIFSQPKSSSPLPMQNSYSITFLDIKF